MFTLVGWVLGQELDHQFDIDGDFSDICEAVRLVAVRRDKFIINSLQCHADDVAVGSSEGVAVAVHLAEDAVEPGPVFLFHRCHAVYRPPPSNDTHFAWLDRVVLFLDGAHLL